MTFFRSRIMLALIGLFVIGGISAGIAVFTTPQPLRAALVGAGQANNNSAGGSAATATAASSGDGAGTTTAPATTAPTATTAPAAPPTNTPASGGGQVIGVQGAVASVNVSARTFVVTATSSTVTVVVTGSTLYSGDAKSLAALQQGWRVEVHGVLQSNGNLLATEVNADSGN